MIAVLLLALTIIVNQIFQVTPHIIFINTLWNGTGCTADSLSYYQQMQEDYSYIATGVHYKTIEDTVISFTKVIYMH